uniref:Hedgehog/Intein (Hint) domain-containing protein n=1 Tax=viral metagenome TaxID=1070528 RepID=A0A6C0BAM8_9ZZZZ
MTSINFSSYYPLSTYAILAQTSITSGGTAGTLINASATSLDPPFYGVYPGTSITGTFTGVGVTGSTASSTLAITQLGTTSDTTSATLIGAIKSLTNIIPFTTIPVGGFSSINAGQAVAYKYTGAGALVLNTAVTFKGPGQIAIYTDPAAVIPKNIIFDTGFVATRTSINREDIFWYTPVTIEDSGVNLRMPGIYIAGTGITLTTSTTLGGNLYSLANVILIDNTITPLTLCFLKGTKILTENGYVNVEDLKVGDTVVSYGSIIDNSDVQFSKMIQSKPITWISKFFAEGDASDLPVCFKAGSLGENLPLNDLFVSPGHRMILDEKMVVAGSIVNGETIVQEDTNETIEYYHFELDCHSVIMAEGVLTETFLDFSESKRTFQK